MSIEAAILRQYFAERPTGRLAPGPSFSYDEKLATHTCLKCGALVHLTARAQHIQWHDQLRRAIEEGDFIE
jgi:hypothetical protein